MRKIYLTLLFLILMSFPITYGLEILVDTDMPQSTATAPQYANGSTINISFTASDATSGINKTMLYFRNDTGSGFGVWTNSGLFMEGTIGIFSFNPNFSDGIYEFYTIAKDVAGNLEITPTTKDTSTIYDNTPPNTTDNAPISWQTNSPISISLIPSDPQPTSGILWTKYCINSSETLCNILTGLDYALPITINSEGKTIIRYASKDNAGNIQETINKSVFLDTIKPTLTVNTPEFYESGKNATFELICDDASSGCNTSKLNTLFDGCIIYTPEINCVIQLPTCVSTSIQTYTSSVLDKAGNKNTSNSGTYVVKNTEGCSCYDSTDCSSGYCMGNAYCANFNPPEMELMYDGAIVENIQIPLGVKKRIFIRVKNNHKIPETIDFSLYGDPKKLEYMSYFETKKQSITNNKLTITVASGKELYVPIIIFGGKTGTYNLILEADSQTIKLKTRKTVKINMLYIKDGDAITIQTPGLGFIGLLFILFVGAFRPLIFKNY